MASPPLRRFLGLIIQARFPNCICPKCLVKHWLQIIIIIKVCECKLKHAHYKNTDKNKDNHFKLTLCLDPEISHRLVAWFCILRFKRFFDVCTMGAISSSGFTVLLQACLAKSSRHIRIVIKINIKALLNWLLGNHCSQTIFSPLNTLFFIFFLPVIQNSQNTQKSALKKFGVSKMGPQI